MDPRIGEVTGVLVTGVLVPECLVQVALARTMMSQVSRRQNGEACRQITATLFLRTVHNFAN